MFKKFLLVLITVVFTCSAMELEIGDAKQIFFDAYDTYFPSRPTTIKKSQTNKSKEKRVELRKYKINNCFLSFTSSSNINLNSSVRVLINVLSPQLPLTILLKKSELRI